ncbi:MAG: hypothetical protein GF330_03885 [Candidatus Eisenbacteria bacterium]|nr:hypothetical protein [Candidatus Eisenbacteria bacterium]
MIWRILFLAALLCASAATAGATTHWVMPDGSGDFPTIQAALSAAAPGDTVLLGDGLFVGDGNRDLDFGGQAIVLRSLSADPQVCRIDAEGSESDPHRVFDFVSGEGRETVVEAITLSGGYADGECCEELTGGAVYCFASSPTFRDCIVADNYAVTSGGAMICAAEAQPRIEACWFTRNTAANGGALMCGGYSIPEIVDCTFFDNGATTAPGKGGAIHAKLYADPWIAGCTFFGNSASHGSQIYLSDWADPLLERSILAYGLSAEAVYTTEDCNPVFLCCDIYGNEGGDWTEGIADQLGVNGNISAAPLFCDPSESDLHLHTDSPCLPGAAPECGLIGAWPIGCPATGVPADVASANLRLRLAPNPTTAGARLSYVIPGTQQRTVVWELLDAAGRRLQSRWLARQSPGTQRIDWDGDDAGRPLPSGLYYHRLRVGPWVRTIPAIILR